jgi:hypothetical protein
MTASVADEHCSPEATQEHVHVAESAESAE